MLVMLLRCMFKNVSSDNTWKKQNSLCCFPSKKLITWCLCGNLKVLQGIVKECLSSAIPSTSKELEGFHEVVAITKKFQERLVALGFIDASSQTLLDYVQNVNVLFANKKCQGILEQARSLMTSDLHDTVQVGDQWNCFVVWPAFFTVILCDC